MKNRCHGPPLATVSTMDSWEDGSWTVDCSCGVTFDDGEEMVDCDECGVWVHTRCSGFIKGEASFTCEKCEANMPRSSSANQNGSRNNGNTIAMTSNNEETEVAQLLVELPTKADTFPPPMVHQTPAFRPWTQIPMEERVHVNGVPGGDPALFQGISSVISSSLWNCTGYVPKKFNFKHKDFSSLDGDENENPANTGANLLFSLSKETAPFGAANILSQMPSLKRSLRRDGKVLCSNDGKNSVKKDRNKHQSFSISSGKREELSIMSKGISGKKKNMAYGCKTSVNNKKRGLTPTTDACILDQDMAFHGQKPDFLGFGGVDKREGISPEPLLITWQDRNDSGDDLVNTVQNSVTTGKAAALSMVPGNYLSSDSYVKLEKLDDHHMKVKIPSKRSDIATTTHGTNCIRGHVMKEEDNNTNAIGSEQLTNASNNMENLMGGSSAVEEENELKHVSGELISDASNLLIISAHPDSSSEFLQGPMKTATKEELIPEDIKAVRNLDIQDPPLDMQKLDFKNSSSLCSQRQVDRSYEEAQIHELTSVLESDMQNLHDGDMEPESRHHDCKKSQETKCSIHIETKNILNTTESASGTTETFEYSSEKYFGSSNKNSNSADGDHKMIEPVGKSSSALFQSDISKLPTTARDKSPGTPPSTSTTTIPFTKRLKLDNGSVGKTDNGENVVSRLDTISGEMSRKTVKTHSRSSGSLSDKTSQKRVSYAPTSKHRVINSKENLLCQSSKTSSKGDSPNSLGPGKTPGSFRNQSNSMPLKFRTSGSSQKNERMSPSSSQVSGKFSNHLAAMCPSSSANVSGTLSDEELAKRLHQELNSSPRVSRISRGFPTIGMQSCSSASGSMLSKHSSSGGKHQAMVSKRKNKDETHGTSKEKDRPDLLQTSGPGKEQVSLPLDGSANDELKRLSDDAIPSSERSAELASTTALEELEEG